MSSITVFWSFIMYWTTFTLTALPLGASLCSVCSNHGSRDAAGAITGLLNGEKQTDHRMYLLVVELAGTDHLHNALVDEVRALQARVNVLEEAEVESQEIIGELEIQLAAALEPAEVPDFEPEDEPEEVEDEDTESFISSASSGA
ncbi:hypothetical protein L1987_15647 [Smallanthus sonchifolius]|uniref:Uncharacterized protein n=1 Tax=Smallanthus sonchifolius TaxID=185202 RepID=A0ACB9J674_9ASTR|nr:hypothetical protein L1987_15647 [Smallanthus sonchifolius]